MYRICVCFLCSVGRAADDSDRGPPYRVAARVRQLRVLCGGNHLSALGFVRFFLVCEGKVVPSSRVLQGRRHWHSRGAHTVDSLGAWVGAAMGVRLADGRERRASRPAGTLPCSGRKLARDPSFLMYRGSDSVGVQSERITLTGGRLDLQAPRPAATQRVTCRADRGHRCHDGCRRGATPTARRWVQGAPGWPAPRRRRPQPPWRGQPTTPAARLLGGSPLPWRRRRLHRPYPCARRSPRRQRRS